MKILFTLLLIWSSYSGIVDKILRFKTDYQKQSEWGILCNSGSQQSPINIFANSVNQYSNKTLNIQFKDISVKVWPSLDIDLRSKYDKSNLYLILDNHYHIKYTSKEYLFHTPSEHTINGHHVDLQFEIIYQIDKDFSQYTKSKYAVVSFLFRQVSNFWPHATIFHDLDFTSVTNINLGSSFGRILPQLWFFNYMGSLTTPPACDKGVDRYVAAKIFEIKQSEFDQIRKRINNQNPNNRLVQRLHKRKIFRIKNTLRSQFNKIQSILKRPSTQYFQGKQTVAITPNFNSLILPTALQTNPLTHKTNFLNHIQHIRQSHLHQNQIYNYQTEPTSYNWEYHVRKAINENPNLRIPVVDEQYYVGQHPALNYDKNKFSIKQGLHLANSRHTKLK